MEKTTWEAWANNDAAAYGKLLAKGHIEIGSGGITIGKAENIAGVESCDVRSYELGEITAHPSRSLTVLPPAIAPSQTQREPLHKREESGPSGGSPISLDCPILQRDSRSDGTH